MNKENNNSSLTDAKQDDAAVNVSCEPHAKLPKLMWKKQQKLQQDKPGETQELAKPSQPNTLHQPSTSFKIVPSGTSNRFVLSAGGKITPMAGSCTEKVKPLDKENQSPILEDRLRLKTLSPNSITKHPNVRNVFDYRF